MRRAMASLLAAALLAVMVVAPAGAMSTATFGISPICYNAGWNALQVNINWANQTPGTGDLIVTLAFSGKKLNDSLPLDYVAPVASTASSPTLILMSQLPGFAGANSVTSVSASTAGAFVAAAKVVRQPHGGWAACP